MGDRHGGGMLLEEVMRRGQVCVVDSCQSVFTRAAASIALSLLWQCVRLSHAGIVS